MMIVSQKFNQRLCQAAQMFVPFRTNLITVDAVDNSACGRDDGVRDSVFTLQ